MDVLPSPQTAKNWLREASSGDIQAVEKATADTLAWFVSIDNAESFAKWFPTRLLGERSEVERSIAGGALHPAIVELCRVVQCCDGDLFLYRRARGEDLAIQSVRARFSRLPLASRRSAVDTVFEALSAVCDAGYVVVDWYEGNMLYDFQDDKIWLFDWELCRRAVGFVLEMDSNYGSSRLMAPEEFVRGSTIDQRSLVFNLGRFAMMNLPELAEPLAEVFAKATYPAKAGRYRTVREFLTDMVDQSPM